MPVRVIAFIRHSLLLSGIMIFIPFVIKAQTESADQSNFTQYWLDYNMKHKVNDVRSVSGFLGFRTKAPDVYNRYVINATYKIRHLKSPKFINFEKPVINSFHLGGGLFYTDYSDKDDNFEFRLMQGFQVFTPELKGIYLNNYVRLEERFQTTPSDSWTFGLRMRYKISTVFEWKKKGETFEKGVYLPMSIEFFFNFKESDRNNDQIRISPGIGYKFNSDWRCELMVSYHNTTNDSEDNQTDNDLVFRIRLIKSNIKKGIFIHEKEEQLKEIMEE